MHFKKGMQVVIQSALNLWVIFLVTFCGAQLFFQIDLIDIMLG